MSPISPHYTGRGLQPHPIYLSRRHGGTEKDKKQNLSELRDSVRDNLICGLTVGYKYCKNKIRQ